jgi:hypothetical protein
MSFVMTIVIFILLIAIFFSAAMLIIPFFTWIMIYGALIITPVISFLLQNFYFSYIMLITAISIFSILNIVKYFLEKISNLG